MYKKLNKCFKDTRRNSSRTPEAYVIKIYLYTHIGLKNGIRTINHIPFF